MHESIYHTHIGMHNNFQKSLKIDLKDIHHLKGYTINLYITHQKHKFDMLKHNSNRNQNR